jgi:sRNA-binding carbon storage regulator CsrA
MMMLSVENNESDSVAVDVLGVEEHPVNINATQPRTIRYTRQRIDPRCTNAEFT